MVHSYTGHGQDSRSNRTNAPCWLITPNQVGRRECAGTCSCEDLVIDLVDDLVGHPQVLDGVAADVSLWHAPELIAVFAGANDLRWAGTSPQNEKATNMWTGYADVQPWSYRILYDETTGHICAAILQWPHKIGCRNQLDACCSHRCLTQQSCAVLMSLSSLRKAPSGLSGRAGVICRVKAAPL